MMGNAAVAQRGAKVKMKLEIDPLHAETVRLIYRLALHGDGAKGQVGVKTIVRPLTATASSRATEAVGHRPIPPHSNSPHAYGRA
jgi:hypothetical protein